MRDLRFLRRVPIVAYLALLILVPSQAVAQGLDIEKIEEKVKKVVGNLEKIDSLIMEIDKKIGEIDENNFPAKLKEVVSDVNNLKKERSKLQEIF